MGKKSSKRTRKKPRKRALDYTVGWICALPVEYAAATAMLDEVHDSLSTAQGDSNTYTLGRIGKHNVTFDLFTLYKGRDKLSCYCRTRHVSKLSKYKARSPGWNSWRYTQ
jgi:hypothetical protein